MLRQKVASVMQALTQPGTYDFEDVNLTQLFERVLACFQPTMFSVAVHTDIAGRELRKKFPLDLNGYHCGHKSHPTTKTAQ
ncbi:S-adenosylmethionine decarboxylase proenzyme [Morella rubra]|uniref:S-adenosylmethionine decarboxylase proenzyme n=1 Tax=Morella rubra TaxID=262757 RepID=A0A6A1WIW1_9ROSI|nr:S-adenosylmethionine decarboxylase proenzyme [Morella rubra]KAB1222812.1 S-adenosylmethionine decarboxylase proenzyme [Morella rubra]